jgi:hypothetical protein
MFVFVVVSPCKILSIVEVLLLVDFDKSPESFGVAGVIVI